ncbi:alpha/beta fold hydrolase [Paraburkholderia caribensis]|uniref:alpha/beta fold hydrolase n=1 Tax=Paraburkholderia caribensis TaxID=75105 RepID=UPI001CAD7650|nr:alpha/beta hydrolase [Paraburkholderia caribensis]CAG9263012.1 2-hydroxy-6-oxo-2,4-heptadienoate hydrolase [Paraburkholderia caribensis]
MTKAVESTDIGPAGRRIDAGGIDTNYHEFGEGFPLILLHGSGAGVTGWENWHGVMHDLAKQYRVIVPDIVGFGLTSIPDGIELNIKIWVRHLIDLMDALNIQKAALVGNSFGGALALATSMRHGDRVERMVLMGTPAGDFVRADNAGSSWHYEPSLENMGKLLRHFPYDPSWVTEDMVRQRYETSLKTDSTLAYRKLFPEPSKTNEPKVIHGIPEERLDSIQTPVLVLHGREDKMVPVECGWRIASRCANADLHVFSKCGHWVQIERRTSFIKLTVDFLTSLQHQSVGKGAVL